MSKFVWENGDSHQFAKIIVSIIVMMGFLVMPLVVFAQVTGQQIIIPFEEDAQGNPIVAGQVIDDEYAATASDQLGVLVTTNDPVNHPVIVYDTAVIGGADPDLGTPNETCATPGLGVGVGGEVGQPGENCTALGNVLILSTTPDYNSDGIVTIPNDYVNGGTITLTFSVPVQVDYLDVLDIEENGLIISVLDSAGQQIRGNITPLGLGDNSFEQFTLGDQGVTYLVAHFPGSGALSSVAVTPMEPLAVRLRDFGGNHLADYERVWFLALALVLLVGTYVGYRRINKPGEL